jgi:SHS2 domain-containing protein
MSDVVIEAFGPSLENAFENAARALEDTLVDIRTVEPKLEERISLQAPSKEALLYDWLELLIIKLETEGMLYSRFECNISNDESGYSLEAKLAGERFQESKHEQKVAVKAPTYHEMKIDERPDRVVVRFLLDL